MSANLIIGTSHALQFAKAIGTHSAIPEAGRDDIIALKSPSGRDTRLLYAAPKPSFIQLNGTNGDAADVAFGPPIDEIRTFNSKGSKVFLMLGGNEAAAFFLERQPRPFDFVIPELPDTRARWQIVPLAVVETILSNLLANGLRSTRALATELPEAGKYYISAPPPIPSEEHIRKFPEIFDFEQYGVEDRLIRLKAHKLHMRIMRNFCARNDITFVDSSISKIDDAGFLKEEYWEGCTHATPSYYSDVVEALEL